MSKIIALFNHKGGVGKTTLCHNIGYTLAVSGKKVLMLDADPQCNLSCAVLGLDAIEAEEVAISSLFDVVAHAVGPRRYKALAHPENACLGGKQTKQENLHLVKGDIRLAELDMEIAAALTGFKALDYIPGDFFDAIHGIIDQFDFVLLDLSPTLSATNQLWVMLSDYLITPAFPDIFSKQAFSSFSTILKTWNRNISGFDPRGWKPPVYLGVIMSNFNPYQRKDQKDSPSAKRFEARAAEINQLAIDMGEEFASFGLSISKKLFQTTFRKHDPYVLAQIPDYNQLKLCAEEVVKPICALQKEDLQNKEIYTPYCRKKKVDHFKKEYVNIARGLLGLVFPNDNATHATCFDAFLQPV